MIFKIDVLKVDVHRKTPVLESLFNNIAGLTVCNFIRKRLHRRCFLVENIAKFLRTAFYRTLLLVVASKNELLNPSS